MTNANLPDSVLECKHGRILVAAASGRALAASSLRARRPVSVIDLFADRDTVAICENSSRHLLPNQAPNFALQCSSMDEIFDRGEQLLSDSDFQDKFGPVTILIGGGLENYFRNHQTSHKLMQQPGVLVFFETARWVHVNEFCRANSIRYPSITRQLNTNQATQRWLIKTDFSSGGFGVQFAQPNTSLKTDQYFQRYIEGQSISACYVAAPGSGGEEKLIVEMLGICEPVISSVANSHDRSSDQPFPFRYAGSIGPVYPSCLAEPILAEFKRIGVLVANRFGSAGIFGIDFVLEQDKLWLLEINPRITASAELIEHAARQTMQDFSIVKLHLEARSGDIDQNSASLRGCQKAIELRSSIFAKQIVYRHHQSSNSLRVTQSHLDALASHFGDCEGVPEFGTVAEEASITDVPSPGTDIVAGQPILTVHVCGGTKADAGQRLAQASDVLEKIFNERLS